MSAAAALFTPTTPADPLPPLEATNPGSPTARRLGCACPDWLNAYGRGVRTGPSAVSPGEYLTHPACRLHAGL